jgi:hypothetical protein
VIAHAEMTAMAFEMRLGEVVIEKGVVFQFRGVDFERIEV